MARVLAIRLSALGDVAMLVPVLFSVAKHYPEDEFILLTKSPLLPIFEHRPFNIKVLPVLNKDKHKGIRGLIRLITELSALDIDKVADIHDVLRSQQIRRFFRWKGKKIAVIDKGRAEKKALTRKKRKNLYPLKTSIQRYKDVFTSLGYDFPIDFKNVFEYEARDFSLIEPFVGTKNEQWVGIAPFAKHKGKTFPLEKMEEVLKSLSLRNNIRIFLFGGKEEEEQLEKWMRHYNNVTSVAGHFSFSTELLLMSYLNVMITMDSGNMHLASLVGTPVISIWGATHPFAGFYGYNQDLENAVQIDLYCRPCSIYGNKPCFRKDYACLNWITPEMVIKKVDKFLDSAKIEQI